LQELKVIYQDEHICAIHKPPEINFHSSDDALGIVQITKKHFNNEQLYPVHRLDKMTSGLMVFAKTPKVNSTLSQQLSNKTIEKYYLGISQHKPHKKQGAIIGDMKKGRGGNYLLLRDKSNPAVTRFFSKSIIDNLGQRSWCYVLKPETGKTHQLRVALKSLGSPILGDQRYGQQGADRGYLHAYKMRFKLDSKLYELVDPYFEGEHFVLQDEKNTQLLKDFLVPDRIKWPKGAFTLNV